MESKEPLKGACAGGEGGRKTSSAAKSDGEEGEERMGSPVPLEITLNCLFEEDGNSGPGSPVGHCGVLPVP